MKIASQKCKFSVKLFWKRKLETQSFVQFGKMPKLASISLHFGIGKYGNFEKSRAFPLMTLVKM